MKNYIKTYNVFHGILDKLIFGFGIPVAFIVLFAIMNLKFDVGAFMVLTIFMLLAELIRDYFLFGGIYSRSRKCGALRCSYYGEKVYVGAIMQEQLRSFLHYAILMAVFAGMRTVINGYPGKRFVLVCMIYALLFYLVNAISVNILRYVTNFNIYPSIMTLLVTPGIIASVFIYILGIDKKTMNLELCMAVMIVLAIGATILTYRHAKSSYKKSLYGRDNR
ncbi:MAG: hypothetical protein K6G06_03310 [Butyrivibrio sp.]|nr:hypothetical protein [Butyrivibrio sp.]